MEEEVSLFKGIVTSLELEKTSLLDKIAMLEQVVRNTNSDFNDSIQKNTNLQASVVGLEGLVCQLNGDMEWVLSSGILIVVDKIFADSSFYEPNRDLQTICVVYNRI